jgi:hypothetical protein
VMLGDANITSVRTANTSYIATDPQDFITKKDFDDNVPTTPSLQAVTDVGETTTNNIDAASFNSLQLFAQTGVDVDNIGIGVNALSSNTGIDVTAVGTSSLSSNTGNYSVGFGYQSGLNSTTAQSTFIGTFSGQNNAGLGAIALGYNAGNRNQGISAISIGQGANNGNLGIEAVSIGESAGYANSGQSFIGIGAYAGFSNEGDRNISIGWSAGRNVTQDNTTSIGYQTGYYSQADNNTFLGHEAGRDFNDDTGGNVTFDGADVNDTTDRVTITAHGLGTTNTWVNVRYTEGAGGGVGGLNSGSIYLVKIIDANTVGFYETQTGIFKKGVNITSAGSGTGHTLTPQFEFNANYVGATFNDLELFAQIGVDVDNIGIGVNALSSNTGNDSIGIGTNALASNSANEVLAIGLSSGQFNTATRFTGIGINSGYQNIGSETTFLGYFSGYRNQSTNSVGVGNFALQNNSGISSIGIGYGALQNNTASLSIGMGHLVGQRNTGTNSISIGESSHYYNSGNYSIALGSSTGQFNEGDYNTSLGFQSNFDFKDNTGGNVNFDNTDINISTDRITITAHGLGATNDWINIRYTEGTAAISGLTDGNLYKIKIIDANTVGFREIIFGSTYAGVNISDAGKQDIP